jgi:DNA-binding MarR family transcriptional regulator
MRKTPARFIDPFDRMLGYHLRRASVAVMNDLTRRLAHLRLKPADASVLFLIRSNAGLTQSEVGRTLGILRANMAPLTASLVRKGLIVRKRVDGRSQALRLSAAGEAICREAWETTLAHEERMFGALPKAARRACIEDLQGVWQGQGVESGPEPGE